MTNRTISFIAFLLFMPLTIFGQLQTNTKGMALNQTNYNNLKKYKTWALMKNNQYENGYLYQVTNSKIMLLPATSRQYDAFLKDRKENQKVLSISAIQQLKIRNDKSVKKGFLIGFCTGISTALLVGGAVGGFDFNSEYGGIGLVIMMGTAVSGTLVGGIIGSLKKKQRLDSTTELERLRQKGIQFSF